MSKAPAGLTELTKTVYGEARGESEEGRRAVAHVVVNRTKKTGNTVATECSNGEFEGYTNFKAPTAQGDRQAYEDIQSLCTKVLNGTDADPTGGATHFATSQTPGFAHEVDTKTGKPKKDDKGNVIRIKHCAQIGAHYFFKGIPGRYK
jgi:spore germination cell wall hydrolase CwlJ-like protein